MTLAERHERGDHWAGKPHKQCPRCKTDPVFAEQLAKRNKADAERAAFWAKYEASRNIPKPEPYRVAGEVR